MSMLEDMFSKQRELQERLYPFFLKMTTKGRADFIKEHSLHLTSELHEALYELPYFKPWKDYSSMSDTECAAAFHRVREELVDVWHFFINVMLVAGLTPEMLYKMYLDKNAENHKRQDDGYTHDVSYRGRTGG